MGQVFEDVFLEGVEIFFQRLVVREFFEGGHEQPVDKAGRMLLGQLELLGPELLLAFVDQARKVRDGVQDRAALVLKDFFLR